MYTQNDRDILSIGQSRVNADFVSEILMRVHIIDSYSTAMYLGNGYRCLNRSFRGIVRDFRDNYTSERSNVSIIYKRFSFSASVMLSWSPAIFRCDCILRVTIGSSPSTYSSIFFCVFPLLRLA